nr:hypothetical protein [Tanacetum cinerariifolium]GEZ91067.1 hypothetical protein [Tanacetum cinerariifolium]
MILESVENGPLRWPTIEENGVTRPKKYSELSATEATQADCDAKATNIILQGLHPEVYERECKLYDEFDKFSYKKGKSLRDFYLGFSLLLNAINIYNVKLEQFQVNTKFLNTLPPEWSKFVKDVKLSPQYESPYQSQQYSNNQSSTSLSITYPSKDYQSLVHHNVYSPPSSIPQLEYASIVNQQQQPEFPKLDSGLTVPVFKQDPGIAKSQARQNVITHNAVYQADDLDAYDSNCDELNTVKVFLMDNWSHYGLDALAKVHNPNNMDKNMKNQGVQVMPSSEQLTIVKQSKTEITSDRNIIPYS